LLAQLRRCINRDDSWLCNKMHHDIIPMYFKCQIWAFLHFWAVSQHNLLLTNSSVSGIRYSMYYAVECDIVDWSSCQLFSIFFFHLVRPFLYCKYVDNPTFINFDLAFSPMDFASRRRILDHMDGQAWVDLFVGDWSRNYAYLIFDDGNSGDSLRIYTLEVLLFLRILF